MQKTVCRYLVPVLQNPWQKLNQLKKTDLRHPLNPFLALSSAEKKKKPSIESMFDDVYDVRTPELERQYAELLEHLDEYGDKYNLDIYHKS